MSKKAAFTIGFFTIVLVAGTIWLFSPGRAKAPVSPEPESLLAPVSETATTSSPESVVPKKSAPLPLVLVPLAKGDTILSWDFKGAYVDQPTFMTKAETEIKRLSGLVGSGTYPDTNLYVGIANQYDLLGEGQKEYEFLSRAVQVGGTASGLPWHNLGVLMERLGAFQTARSMYEKATLIQPGFKSWQYAYLDFLTTRMKGETVVIDKAFASAFANIGQDDAYLLQLQSEWKKS